MLEYLLEEAVIGSKLLCFLGVKDVDKLNSASVSVRGSTREHNTWTQGPGLAPSDSESEPVPRFASVPSVQEASEILGYQYYDRH